MLLDLDMFKLSSKSTKVILIEYFRRKEYKLVN